MDVQSTSVERGRQIIILASSLPFMILRTALLTIPVHPPNRFRGFEMVESVGVLKLHLLTSNRIPTLFIELDVLLATVQNQFSDTEIFRRRIESLNDGQA
ncbi:hypothetical protein KCU90_g102, partial [Aureobasidium melanogenum]